MRWALRSVPADEVAACRVALQSWQDPGTFWDVSTALRRRLKREEFFNIPALSFLREAWTLGRFANCRAQKVFGWGMTGSLTGLSVPGRR
jgi:hypothetical protein